MEYFIVGMLIAFVSYMFGHWRGWSQRGELEERLKIKEIDLKIKQIELQQMKERVEKCQKNL